MSQFQNTALEFETSTLYLISVDLNLDQNLLKNLNLSFVSYDTKEQTFTKLNNFVFPEQSFTMYAASLNGEFRRFFYSADIGVQQGDNLTTSQTMETSMIHGKAGLRVNSSSGLKIYTNFHRDTGDKNSTADTNEAYNPLFYNHFLNAGRMNLLAWGNLTSYGLGFSVKWSDKTTMALEYNKFLRTNVDAGINGLSPTGMNPLTLDDSNTNSGPFNNNLNSIEKDIGDEFDLVIDFNSDLGLKFQSITGVFLPGLYLEDYSKTTSIFFQRFGLEFIF